MLFPLPSDATKRYITSITDACGNVASFNYDSNGLLTSIADGAGRATTFTYASGMLTKIQAPDQQYVNFEYANQRLTKITHSNLGAVTLIYDENGLLQEAGNADGKLGGVGVRIGYQDVNAYDASAIYGIESCKVTSLMQTGIENCGAMLCFDYLTGMTKVKSLKSGNASAAEGKTISYQFNVNGNLVCAFDELGYARRADFDDYNAEKLSSRMQKAVVNLAKNLAFSSDPAFAGDWIYARVPAADTVVQDGAARCLSMPSLKIVKTGAGETFARQTVQANKTGKYTFSAYIKTEGLTGGGAFLRVKSGSTIVTSAVVQGSTDSASCGPAAEGWERVYVSVDSSAGDITLELVCGVSGGTAHFACPQLEEGEIANRANLLTNGDFARTVINTENTSADRLFPADWIPATGISTDTSNCVLIENHNMPTFLSGNALQMVSFPASANVGFNQEVPVSGAKGDVFVIGGWVSSHSVSSGSDQSAPCIAYRFTNGSTDGAWQYANFNREWVGWQFGAWAIAAPTAYTKVTFSVNYARNAQTAMFSNMFLYREQFGKSFDYDSNKNLISVENLAGQKSEMKYDSYDNLTSYVQPGAPTTEKYTLTYGSTAADQKKHLVQSSSTPEGVDQQFQYDAYGNLTQSKTVDGTNAVIGTKTEYALNSNYPSKTYDARGNAVTRSINGSDYTLTSVTDPAGQAVTYAYDAAKRVTGVQTQADGRTYRNSYKYEKDRIETVAHNTTGDACDVVYRFNYDGLGRKTSVQVGNATSQTKTLSTNKYSEDRSGLLTEVEYGNSTEAKPQKVKYFYDDFDRLTGVAYDSEETPRYTYAYDASGEVAKVTDKHLNRTIETERDLAFRPRQSTLKDAGGNTLYRTTLYYDGRNRLEKFAERAGSADYATAYAYDKDSRTTEINFSETSNGGTANKLTYTYDALGRVQTRTATVGSNNYTTTYDYTAGNAALYGAGATTPLVARITQGSGTNGMNFVYTYDTRGNIISETRNGLVTHYVYDALGQLIQVDDPHEQATWKYYYDRGGNITRKDQYVWPAGATGAPSSLGSPTKTINYGYNDANWKDKLTSYDGKTITYDAIGNPLNDGVRTYTWGAGRQLRHISMLTGETHGFRASNGVHEDSNTVLRIVHDAANSKLKARLLRDGRDVTTECAASAFVWTKNGSAAGTGKEIAVTTAEINGDVQFSCTYTETQGVYGTVQVNNNLVASHTPATADANHTFSLVNGMLNVEVPNSAGNGTDYKLTDGILSVNPGFTGSITAECEFTTSPTREIDFKYDHNGLRTQKIVVENGVTTTYDYTLHGKLITHLTKRTVDENGAESIEELHFFYDAQSRPSFVEYNGIMYRYIHNLQDDIIGLLDGNGNLVVEYKYDAWGKPLSITGTLKTTLGELNPFRYRRYLYDAEMELYYLQNRYYNPLRGRFINVDAVLGKVGALDTHNLFAYCINNPINCVDIDGNESEALIPTGIAVGMSDGPLPLGKIICLLMFLIASGSTSDLSESRSNTKRSDDNNKTYIYRRASGTAKSLTPRPTDTDGLSFSTIQPKSGKYFRTTIEAVNETGILVATADPKNPTHILIHPIVGFTLQDWIDSRETADTNPHPYTSILMSLEE